MLLYIKLPKNIFGFGISQYDKDSTYTMSFNISDFFGSYILPSHLEHGWIAIIWEFGKYLQKENISISTMNCGQNTLKLFLKVKSQQRYLLHVEKCKYTNAESQQCNTLCDLNDNDEHVKGVLNMYMKEFKFS